MKPIPVDANKNKIQGVVSELGTARIRTLPVGGVTIVTPADLKLLMMWTDNAAAFTVGGLGTITGEGTIEDASKTINNAVAVNKGGGLVGIPCTSHGYLAGSTIRIAGDADYAGVYVLDATTSTHEMVVEATYVAKTFAGTETVRQQRTAWTDTIRFAGTTWVDIATDTALTLTVAAVADTVDANILIGR